MQKIFSGIIKFLLATIGSFGYPGIVLLMALESSFFPFPSEIVIPPAAYLAAKGKFNLFIIISMGILGSLIGAWFNYFLALKLGRPWLKKFLKKYGKYILLEEKSLEKVEKFFVRHGHISTFIGRLLPGIRQYISLPAGLAKMNFFLFSVYTALGAGIWVCVLAFIGYFIGGNEALVKIWLRRSSWLLILISIGIVILYLYYHRLSREKKPPEA